MKSLLFLIIIFVSTLISAHEQVPTYPIWKPGPFVGILQTHITVFNKRNDVEYYEVGVFDMNWKPVFFVADEKILHLPYLKTRRIGVYIAKEKIDEVEYVCTRSRIKKNTKRRTAVSSKICSRFRA
jgi:hypothetical protein